MPKESITKKLDQQTKILEEILEDTKKTKKYLLWLKVLNIFKVVVIVVPIVLGIIYLPPQIRKLAGYLQNLIPQAKEYQEILKKLPQILGEEGGEEEGKEGASSESQTEQQ